MFLLSLGLVVLKKIAVFFHPVYYWNQADHKRRDYKIRFDDKDERIVLAIFVAAVIGWITRGLLWKDYFPFLEEHVIVLIAIPFLFLLPSKNSTKQLLDFNTAKNIPWGVLILIGGGIALAGGFVESGLEVWIADKLSFVKGMEFFVIILVIVAVTIFSGELMSNTAGAALLFPIMASLAANLQVTQFC